MTTVSNEGFEIQEPESEKHQGEIKKEFKKSEVNLKNVMKSNDEFIQSGGCFMLLAVKMALMIAVIVFYFTSTHISEIKTCELKTALDSIYLKYTFQPCKYGAVKEMSDQLTGLGKAQFWFNAMVIITFAVMLCVYFSFFENKKIRLFLPIIFLVFFLSAFAFFIANIVIYKTFDEKKNENTEIDYVTLQSSLLSWLQKKYRADSISNSDNVTRGWNIFFIKYDCCAVREVKTTINDFDDTPWCKTSGSCQTTSSQIPRTCCNFVTQDDYQNATSNCYASVTPGTYRPNCINRIRGLSVVEIDECQVSIIGISMLTMIVLQVFEAAVSGALFISGVIKYTRQ